MAFGPRTQLACAKLAARLRRRSELISNEDRPADAKNHLRTRGSCSFHGEPACCSFASRGRPFFAAAAGEFSGRGHRKEPTPQRTAPNSPWELSTSPEKARRSLSRTCCIFSKCAQKMTARRKKACLHHAQRTRLSTRSIFRPLCARQQPPMQCVRRLWRKCTRR